MNIDVKEIQNILYCCNVNFYQMEIDTECECITIALNELIENIAIDELLEELKDIFNEIEFDEVEKVITLFFND